MTTSLTSAINLFEDVFINAAFFDTFIITQMIILFGIMLFITRDARDWPVLAFPIMVGMNAIGFYVNPILMGAAGLIMVISGLSVEGIQSALKAGTMATLGNVKGLGRGAKLAGEGIYTGRFSPKQRLRDYKEGVQVSKVDQEIARLQRRDKIGVGVAAAQLDLEDAKVSRQKRSAQVAADLSDKGQRLIYTKPSKDIEVGLMETETALDKASFERKLLKNYGTLNPELIKREDARRAEAKNKKELKQKRGVGGFKESALRTFAKAPQGMGAMYGGERLDSKGNRDKDSKLYPNKKVALQFKDYKDKKIAQDFAKYNVMNLRPVNKNQLDVKRRSKINLFSRASAPKQITKEGTYRSKMKIDNMDRFRLRSSKEIESRKRIKLFETKQREKGTQKDIIGRTRKRMSGSAGKLISWYDEELDKRRKKKYKRKYKRK